METQQENQEIITLKIKCNICNAEYYIRVKKKDYELYKNSDMHIQDIFPYLTPDERELIISHVCGECFDELFNDIEDEEDEY